MSVVDTWTGQLATDLQAALRLSNDEYAHRLGIGVRTVAAWHARPDTTPRTEIQQILDTTLEKAKPSERQRFEARRTTVPEMSPGPNGLHVAVAVVRRDDAVLLVRRRDSDALTWQFPAGVVKPGSSSETAAVRETLAETGVDCAVRSIIGGRQHPVTDVYGVYYLCEYVAGSSENRDVVENMSVRWSPIDDLTRFVPLSLLYPPILTALEVVT